jgi:hypothetical protein
MNFKNIQEFFWPTINDAESAKKAADHGLNAALLYFFVCIKYLFSENFIAVGIFVLIVSVCGFYARRMYKSAAVLGLIIVLPGTIMLLLGGEFIMFLAHVLICLFFYNSIRGSFAYAKLSTLQNKGYTEGNDKSFPPNDGTNPTAET